MHMPSWTRWLTTARAVIWLNPGYKGAVPFLLLLLFLFVRPQGLFGNRSE